jgi:hypothetical protein
MRRAVRHPGWMAVVVVAAIAVVAVIVDAALALQNGDRRDLIILPLALVIWLALGASAWRRTRFRATSGIRAL